MPVHQPPLPTAPRATDAIVLGTLGLFTALTLAFAGRIDGWAMQVAKNAAVAAAYLLLARWAAHTAGSWGRFLLRMVPVTLTYGYLFLAVEKLHFVLHDAWMDDTVIRWEAALFGGQPTQWLEAFTVPWLTEWMMFAYLFYFVMYPLVCVTVRARHGEAAVETCFFTLGLTNILCDLGFILFPVAGPGTFLGAQYTVPLDGWWFTGVGEFVRSQLQYPGGSIPSPHCAAATVMWGMAWRYERRLFWLLLPVVVSLYLATVYCRYHYLMDAVTGILTAGAVILLAPRLQAAWDCRTGSPVAGGARPDGA